MCGRYFCGTLCAKVRKSNFRYKLLLGDGAKLSKYDNKKFYCNKIGQQ